MSPPVVSNEKGFTVIELIVVIVLLGILAMTTTQFIVSSATGFADQSRREGIATASRVAMDRLIRELRNALPNSVRTNGSCLEYIPVEEATQYFDAPFGSAASSLSMVPFSSTPNITTNQTRAAIYPISTTAVYNTGTPSVISPTISSSAASLVSLGAVSLNFNASHQFDAASPQSRLFLIAPPVSWCFVGDRLYRYTGYNRTTNQPTVTSLPNIEPNRGLMAYPVVAGTPFRISDATLTRNALVIIEYQAVLESESLLIHQEVQIRNAP
jgi:MSHA biogenesis protein MshO